jgi:hypothetical protein
MVVDLGKGVSRALHTECGFLNRPCWFAIKSRCFVLQTAHLMDHYVTQ